MEVVAVIEPEAEIAGALTQSGNVGVLATPATVRSGSYLRRALEPAPCPDRHGGRGPDLAAVIQRGFPFSESVVEMVRSYCEPLKRAEVDTVILGCTHYPLVRPMLQRVLGREVRLVTAGTCDCRDRAARPWRCPGSRRAGNEEGTYRFLCTGDAETFRELGTRFLQMPLGDVERVDLP